jgi:hypothetical protein
MTKWKPHTDLARLLEALSREIMATSEDDVRGVCAADERSMEAAANRVRDLVAAAMGDDVGEIEASLPNVESPDHREYRHRN